jgi:hypothetical protein
MDWPDGYIDTGTNAAALPIDTLLADSSDPDGVIWDPELAASCSWRRFLQ